MPVSFELEWNGPVVFDAFHKRALTAIEKAGVEAERTAKSLAPVGSRVYTDPEGNEHPGFLRDSVYVIAEPTQEGTGFVLIVGDSAPYAVFMELGAPAANVAAHPFIRPAGDQANAHLIELLAREGEP